MLQKAGGNFTLTADVNFGPNFGLLSAYFTSRSANPAASGVFRLANTDRIAFRNAANNADLLFGPDASNNLTWNGAIIASASGVVPIAAGGTGQTTQQAAINALTGTQSSGKYLRSDGANATLATIQAGDVPTLNQNTTGTASNVTGTVAIANGGTGQTS